MKYTKLGNSGLHVSLLGFGTMAYGGAQYKFTDFPVSEEDALRCLQKAHESGINYLDCADIYGAYGNAEAIIGKFLQDYDRSDFVISSKVMFPMSINANDRGLSKKHIHDSISKTLKRLKTDYLDIYYCHRYDFSTPLDETLYAMNDLIDQGKILHWATSNWRAVQLERVFGISSKLGLRGPICDQMKFNMFQRYAVEVELPYTADYYGFGVVAYRILAEKVLTGAYNNVDISQLPEEEKRYVSSYKGKDPKVLEKVGRLLELAQEQDLTLPQLVHAWTLQIPHVDTVLMSTRNPDRIEENCTSVNTALTSETLERIEAILNNKPRPVREGITESYTDFNAHLQNDPRAEDGLFPPTPRSF
ncbi:MAG: aldo/keto reductase [Candidatus Thorarchaeota archaeon]